MSGRKKCDKKHTQATGMITESNRIVKERKHSRDEIGLDSVFFLYNSFLAGASGLLPFS